MGRLDSGQIIVEAEEFGRLQERVSALQDGLKDLKDYLENRYERHLIERFRSSERRVDELQADLREMREQTDTRVSDVEQSVNALTRRVAWIVGIGVGVMAVITIIGSIAPAG